MPLYEYLCESTGERIELLRSAADADKPVDAATARAAGARQVGAFHRVQSVFASKAAGTQAAASTHVHSASCGCGKPRGSCARP